MKVANIIFDVKLTNNNHSEYVNYIQGIEGIYENLDKKLPTLYVGWEFMKQLNPNDLFIQNANILEKVIVPNKLYWEFAFGENKSSHVNGINMFVINAPHYYFKSNYEYTNLDPVYSDLYTTEDVMNSLPESIEISYTYNNEMLYLLNDNKIIGINIKMFRFFKFNVEEILELIGQRTEIKYDDVDGSIYSKFHKIFPNYMLLKRYIISMLK